MGDVKSFWSKWQVFILGALSALVLAIQTAMANPAPGEDDSLQKYLLAAGLAILSYVAKEWRGKGVTVLGIIGIAAGVIVQQAASGQAMEPWQIVIAMLTAILAAVAPPPKADTYETNAAIVEAKTLPPHDQVKDDSPAIPPANKADDEYRTSSKSTR